MYKQQNKNDYASYDFVGNFYSCKEYKVDKEVPNYQLKNNYKQLKDNNTFILFVVFVLQMICNTCSLVSHNY